MTDATQDNKKKLFVGNLPWSVDNDKLSELFSEFGDVTDAHVMTDRQTGRSRGFAFVEFATEDAAAEAVKAMNEKELEGRALVVNIARPKTSSDRPRRSGNSYGGNRSNNSYRGNRNSYDN